MKPAENNCLYISKFCAVTYLDFLHARIIHDGTLNKLEIVITRAAPAFHKLFMVMGCVFDINTVHKTVEKLTFQAFYWSSHSCK